MQIDNSGIALIQGFEGTKLQAYQDVKGVWTIGTGTTIYPNGNYVKRGDVITQAQADQYLQYDLQRFVNSVNSLVKVPLSQNQFNALVSLVYNIGSTAFANSTLLRTLNSGNYNIDFTAWKYSGGRMIQGLLNRRIAEQNLFRS